MFTCECGSVLKKIGSVHMNSKKHKLFASNMPPVLQMPTFNINYEYKDSPSLKWFTDGSVLNNGKPTATGGWAAVCVGGSLVNTIMIGGSAHLNMPPTNITMEYFPIYYILELFLTSDNTRCEIYTDSLFWKDMLLKYMPKWSDSTFDEKANPHLTKKLWDLWNRVVKTKSIELIHVYAHNKMKTENSTDPYQKFCYDNNAIADQLATYGRLNSDKIAGDFITM
jgi:ribonuclease HI